jgi:hypothetical protein
MGGFRPRSRKLVDVLAIPADIIALVGSFVSNPCTYFHLRASSKDLVKTMPSTCCVSVEDFIKAYRYPRSAKNGRAARESHQRKVITHLIIGFGDIGPLEIQFFMKNGITEPLLNWVLMVPISRVREYLGPRMFGVVLSVAVAMDNVPAIRRLIMVDAPEMVWARQSWIQLVEMGYGSTILQHGSELGISEGFRALITQMMVHRDVHTDSEVDSLSD